jgi:hypothetical protein
MATPGGSPPIVVPADEEAIERWKRDGELTEEQAALKLIALRHWHATCREIDALHMDCSVLRAEKVATARYRAVERLLVATPIRTAEDVVAKLRFLQRLDELDYPSRPVVAGLIRDLPSLAR